MTLSPLAIAKINTSDTRLKLALRLHVTEKSIIDYIKSNKNNGSLTKVSALIVIKEETGLTEEEILNEEPLLTI
jgi:hypothetical protein